MFMRSKPSGLTVTVMALCVLISACGGESDSGTAGQPIAGVPPIPQPPPLPPPPTPPPVVATVSVTPESIEMAALGQSVQLTATALDQNGQPMPDAAFRWTSSHPEALEVSETGLVTARANGSATITAATDRGLIGEATDAAEARVQQAPVSMSVSPESWPLAEAWVGARRQFSADVRDANGHPIPDADVTWSIGNANASVDETGLATARQPGNTTVTATVAGLADGVDFRVLAEGSAAPGYMYTVWVARTDDAPAVLVNGALRLSEAPYGDVPYDNTAENSLEAPWPHDTIEKFQYAGNRIGLLTDVANGLGTLRILDRAREWLIPALGNTQDFQIEGNLVGVLLEGGAFRIWQRSGDLSLWTTQAESGATAFQLEGDRIAVQLEDGRLLARDGLGLAWVTIDATGARAFQLEGNRIGVLRASGELLVKDTLAGTFTTLASAGAKQFRLKGNRIALLKETGEFMVKDGINGPWTLLATQPIRQFELEGNRIGILFESGEFRVKDGISGAWTLLATEGVQSFQLQGNRIGVLTNEGRLRIKSGINGAWANTPAYGAGVTQYRLIVDNPVQPRRTTPSSYAAGQNRCRTIQAGTGDNNCYHEAWFDIPVPNYGLYCGGGRPTNFSGAWGEGGPIDALDTLCMHHDLAGTWYAGVDWSGNPAQSCVVRYGLMRGRLTRDGQVIATGNSSESVWDAAWGEAGMVNLYDALEYYWAYTDGCDDAALASFDAQTDASH